MKTIILNFDNLETKEEIQEYLKDQFGYAGYYGGNLDAFYDELTAVMEETSVRFDDDECDTCCEAAWDSDAPVRSEEMRQYLIKVRRVIEDAAEENKNLHL